MENKPEVSTQHRKQDATTVMQRVWSQNFDASEYPMYAQLLAGSGSISPPPLSIIVQGDGYLAVPDTVRRTGAYVETPNVQMSMGTPFVEVFVLQPNDPDPEPPPENQRTIRVVIRDFPVTADKHE